MNNKICLIPFFCLATAAFAGDDWTQFRGPTQQGYSDSTGLPTEWSESQNIKFKTDIPGEGWSSPVVLGKQIWMTTATEAGHSLRAICVDRETGKILHDIEVFHVEPDKKNGFNSYASPTPVLEPGRIYISFGNYGNACLDTATGEAIWKTNELKLDHKEGPGSAPIIYKNLFILHCDGMDAQYVAALEKATGKVAWKTSRSFNFSSTPNDRRKAFCTPLVATVAGKDQLISIGASRISGYDPGTGTEIWWCNIPGYSNVPRPVYANGVAYISTGFDQAELWALKIEGATGDISQSGILWKSKKGVPVKPSPLLIEGRIYMVSDNGIARCMDAKTGAEIWQARTGSGYSASLIYAQNLIYAFSEKGVTTVIKPSDKLETIAENQLEGRILATPAIAGKAIFIRTDKSLYRIEK